MTGITLTRSDPARNMHRFYRLDVQRPVPPPYPPLSGLSDDEMVQRFTTEIFCVTHFGKLRPDILNR